MKSRTIELEVIEIKGVLACDIHLLNLKPRRGAHLKVRRARIREYQISLELHSLPFFAPGTFSNWLQRVKVLLLRRGTLNRGAENQSKI